MIVFFFLGKIHTYFFSSSKQWKVIQILLIPINLIFARNVCVFMVVTQCNLIPQTSIKNRLIHHNAFTSDNKGM